MPFETLISVDELNNQIKDADWIVIDCRFNLAEPSRGREDYVNSHVPGSYYAHLDDDLSSPVIKGITGRHPLPDVNEFVQKVRSWGINNDSQVVVYDYASGGIASRLWWLLRWLGHEQVAVLNGGWQAWNRAGLPVSSEIPIFGEGDFIAKFQSSLSIDREGVDQIRHLDNWNLVDSREHNRYLGLEEPIDPIAGHIEGAINHPFLQNVREDGTWKSPEELAFAFQESGLKADPSHTVFYCGSGVTACHNLLAYKYAGLGDAILYPGSWSEWITQLK